MRTSAHVPDEADSQPSSAMTTSLFLDSLYFTAYFGGLKGIFQAVLCRIPLLGRLACWIDRDHEWIGGIVESHGDRASLDGCTFFLGHPVIPTSLKSRFITGRYEKSERYAVSKYLSGHNPVIELGGSIGVVACITNRKLKDPSRHVVVEANPGLIPILEAHRAMNQCSFTVENRALAYGGHMVEFHLDSAIVGGGIYNQSGDTVMVPTTTLGALCKSYEIESCDLICDIEGVEISMVSQEAETLKDRVKTLIIELHPMILGYAETMRIIREIEKDFRLLWRCRSVAVFRNQTLDDRGRL